MRTKSVVGTHNDALHIKDVHKDVDKLFRLQPADVCERNACLHGNLAITPRRPLMQNPHPVNFCCERPPRWQFELLHHAMNSRSSAAGGLPCSASK
jgi:hypothetical protein